jgi:RNA polymerase sigma factor (sigma-70 family)
VIPPSRDEDDEERRLSETVDQVLAIQAGDRRALQELFTRLQPVVLRIVRARMSPRLRRREWSSDLVNMTFEALLRELQEIRLRGRGSLINWLAIVAEHTIRGRAKYWKVREIEVELEALDHSVSTGELSVAPPSPGRTPLETTLDRERLRAVLACLETMTDDQREVLILRHWARCEMEDVTKLMGRSADAVAQLTSRAVTRLTACMANRGFGSGASDN